jgi:hypothetical protein
MAADNSHSVRSHSVHQDDDLTKLGGDRAALSSSHSKAQAREIEGILKMMGKQVHQDEVREQF